MALVTVGNGNGWWLTVTLVDNGDDKSTLQYEMLSADAAAAVTDAAAIIAALVAASDSVVSGYNISLRYEEDAFVYPAAGVENQNKARIVGQLNNSTKKATMDIPAPKIGLFTAPTGVNANIVDLLDTEVLAYLAIFQTGGNAFISDGEVLDFAVEGRRVSSRKGFRG